MKSADSTDSIDARVMRAIGASTKMAIVSTGRISCFRLAHHIAASPASAVSTRYSPVIVGGGENIGSSRPIGDGAQPSRK